MVAIKGHFDGKVFVPDEPVDLPRGQAVVLHVEPALTEADAPPATNGETAWDVLSRLAGTISGPPDWAAQHDHYIHGTPKRPENDLR